MIIDVVLLQSSVHRALEELPSLYAEVLCSSLNKRGISTHLLFALSVTQRHLNEEMKLETKHLKRCLCVAVPPCYKEDVFDIDAAETTGSGSIKAAHPSLSLPIRTICIGAFRRVILSMQSRCHAVSAYYTSVESANLLPHVYS